MNGYDRIKQMAKARGCTIPDLLVLSRNNDPFFVGSPAHREKAAWFASLWNRFGFTTGVHLRRIHYQILSPGDVTKLNGMGYENTEADWELLEDASRYARHLGLVDPAAFVDRRNPEPHLFFVTDPPAAPSCEHEFWPPWHMPAVTLDADLDWELPTIEVHGHEYSDALQPYHVEVWAEKSTMNDVLLPLCRQYSTNLVTGLGYMSITLVVNLLKRARASGKPVRLFYISDFDPAGDGMPTAVARQIEFAISDSLHDYDMKLMPLLLTQEQVMEYHLPRMPVKETDKRKGAFEERYGAGAVELDALEALHPGTLADLVTETILQFYDPHLPYAVRETGEEADENIHAQWDDRMAPYQERLDALKAEVEQIVERYKKRCDQIDKELQAALRPYQDDLRSLRHDVQGEREAADFTFPNLPTAALAPEEDGWLYDSTREYLEQLAVYKARKNGYQETGEQ
jgi:hypothetical protein